VMKKPPIHIITSTQCVGSNLPTQSKTVDRIVDTTNANNARQE